MLKNLKVLSFCHFVQGTTASQYLADMGADVIKVEPPEGAWERKFGSGRIRLDGRAVTFMAVNRNKRSLAINLKHPKAREVLFPIISQCDVVMENYRLNVLDKLGFGYEEVRKHKPDIIYASATGWGSSGPMAKEPGVDLLVQARTGLINAGVRSDENLSMPGLTVIDQHAGTLFALGVLAAYARKLTTGQGGRVETSLLSAGLDLQAESIALYLSGGKKKSDLACMREQGTWYVDPPYGVFRLQDCEVALVGIGIADQLAALLGSEPLANLGAGAYIDRRDEYLSALSNELKNWTFERLSSALEGSPLWMERVASYDDLLLDEQIKNQNRLGTVRSGSKTATVLNPPIVFDGEAFDVRIDPPELGSHTRSILEELDFTSTAIDQLIQEGVVFG